MTYGLNSEQWAAYAKKYLMLSTDEEIGKFLLGVGDRIFDHLDSLYTLVMEETGEPYTQEWRDSLTDEDAAIVAVFDAMVNV